MEMKTKFENLDKTFLLKSLDTLQNAISIYDDKLRLVYANENYCKNMFIDDVNDVLGKTIEEVQEISGVKIFAIQANKEKLAFPDVLKYGKAFVDWEVKISRKNDPQKTKILLFDMYPVKDENGVIKGIVEVSHSRHSDLRKAKKMVGFAAQYTFDSILGESEAIKNRKQQAMNFARSNFNLHIYGESGTGKELFAQAVHNASEYKDGPFVALNCASFPENLIESELFGYVGGAFTGASKNGQMSKFELADGGTLFLDEIGELQLPFQAKLLRVLETNTVTRIGSSTSIPFNVRIISATNRELEKMVEEGSFRRDLYYRLQVLNLEIPPLRDRGRDVILIANQFLENIAELSGEKKLVLSLGAEEAMLSYSWPGNIRELKNAMNRLTVLSKSEEVTAQEVAAAIFSRPTSDIMQSFRGDQASIEGANKLISVSTSPEERIAARMKNVEQSNIDLINEALEIAGGNKNEAAKLLGVSRKTMYNMLHKYNMEL
jgi:sigma-54 dependent transcriptional regulator, acetoin dehydrogenase operon transcriptional activator AcoR